MIYSSCSIVTAPLTPSCVTFRTRCKVYSPMDLNTRTAVLVLFVLASTANITSSVTKLRVLGVVSFNLIQSYSSAICNSHSTFATTLQVNVPSLNDKGSDEQSNKISGSAPSCSTLISCSNVEPAPDIDTFTVPVRLGPSVFSVKNKRRSPFPSPELFDIVNQSPVEVTSAVHVEVAVTLIVNEPSTLLNFTSFFDTSSLAAVAPALDSSSELHAFNNPANNMNRKYLMFYIFILLILY